MKKYIYCIALAWTAMLLGSCESFLEENPGSLTTDANLTSNEVAQAFANSAYTEVDVLAQGAGGWGGNTLSFLEFMTGKATGVPQTEAFKFNELTYDASAFYIGDYWRRFYRGIQNCNIAIEQLSEFPGITDTQRENWLAEVRTLRAFYYFYLVRMFGDVPKVTENISDLGQIETPRSPVKEIYDEVIIPDLLAAENSSLPWKESTGRVSMGFIKALLADVYLTYAGYPVQGGQQFYAESASRSKELIEEGGYSLFPEYADLRDPAKENSGELIFQVQYDEENRSSGLTPVCLPLGFDISAAYADEYGGMVPTEQFVDSYAPGDKRAEEKQFFFTFYTPNRSNASQVNLGAPYIYKYFHKQAVDNDAKSPVNFTVYRLADVMLMYAEASNRAEGGPNALARQCVNDIRDRANLSAIGALSMDAFEKEVWSQRNFELCYEGKMWFDMIRTRMVKNDVSGNWENFVGHTNVFGGTYQEKHLLFPVPKRERDNNAALTQNPGFN